MYAVDRPK